MKIVRVSVLGPVVQRVDTAIHWINPYQADSAVRFFLTLIHWIVIYPVDSFLHPLNNQTLGSAYSTFNSKE